MAVVNGPNGYQFATEAVSKLDKADGWRRLRVGSDLTACPLTVQPDRGHRGTRDGLLEGM